MKKELALVASLALAGCTPSAYDAYTTPIGIVYNTPNPSEQIVKHEEQHWRDYQNDPLFFFWYAVSPEYACESEARANLVAGYIDIFDHPACTKLK